MRPSHPESKVLLVDDDRDIRETLAEILKDEGFDVAFAENGREALSYLEGHAAPCVIVLDLMMPVMTGSEFRQHQLAEPRFADIPVIVLSAADRASTVAAELGVAAFIAKPPRLEVLVDAVTRYC